MADTQANMTIETPTKQLGEAFNAGEFEAMGALYANDAVMLPPRSNIITGKGNIQMFWQRSRRIREMLYEPMNVKSLGDGVIREVGTLLLKMSGAPGADLAGGAQGGDQAREFSGKYVFVWQKIDGEWKLESSIWNRIGPERGNFPLGAAIRRPGQRGPRRA
jgi:ketosteroid isomerase-like protein